MGVWRVGVCVAQYSLSPLPAALALCAPSKLNKIMILCTGGEDTAHICIIRLMCIGRRRQWSEWGAQAYVV